MFTGYSTKTNYEKGSLALRCCWPGNLDTLYHRHICSSQTSRKQKGESVGVSLLLRISSVFTQAFYSQFDRTTQCRVRQTVIVLSQVCKTLIAVSGDKPCCLMLERQKECRQTNLRNQGASGSEDASSVWVPHSASDRASYAHAG